MIHDLEIIGCLGRFSWWNLNIFRVVKHSVGNLQELQIKFALSFIQLYLEDKTKLRRPGTVPKQFNNFTPVGYDWWQIPGRKFLTHRVPTFSVGEH